ncbi:MAG: hypothetical protein PHI24_01085 [Desulfitobacteriaceae bacterium]|nr:hypothetical protein [Desulfitobacteriaceae bacterium]
MKQRGKIVSALKNSIRCNEKSQFKLYVIILVLTFIMFNLIGFQNNPGKTYTSNPWLLEYSSDVQEAEVKLVIWYKNQDLSTQISENLPAGNWLWEKSFTNDGKKIISLVGRTKVDRIKEFELKKWYYQYSNKIRDCGGQVYLDERIYDNIDIVAFLSKSGAKPQQWMLNENTLSVTALKSGLGNKIYAGKDKVNIQLLTNTSKGHKQSVLALPVLIDEF